MLRLIGSVPLPDAETVFRSVARELTHQSIIKTTFLLYKTAGRATAVG